MFGFIGLFLGVTANLSIFLIITVILKKPESMLSNPYIFGFLTIISLFCFVEGFQNYRKLEMISFYSPDRVDEFLNTITGLALLLVLATSLSEYLITVIKMNQVVYLSGLTCTLIGISLRYFAIKALQGAFISLPWVKAGQRLIREFPYNIVRHPSETGLFFICLGIPIMMQSILGILITAFVIFPVSIIRVRREERVLKISYKNSYLDYECHVPRFIPAIK